MSLYNAAENSFFQSLAGYFSGFLLDSFFPINGIDGVNDSNVIKVSIEVILQLGLDAFLAYLYYDFVKRKIRADDPAHGLIFDIANFASQPHLIAKIVNLNTYLKAKWLNGYITPPVVKQQEKLVSNEPGTNISQHPDVPASFQTAMFSE